MGKEKQDKDQVNFRVTATFRNLMEELTGPKGRTQQAVMLAALLSFSKATRDDQDELLNESWSLQQADLERASAGGSLAGKALAEGSGESRSRKRRPGSGAAS